MDLKYFLNNRTKFIRYFHEHAVAPFDEIIDAIENEKEPFIPTYSENPEPPFLEEWLEAKTAIDTVGHTSLSMLASSLQLFLNEWVARLKQDHGMEIVANIKRGWFNGLIFAELGLSEDECPADLNIIEQVTLARNRAQHPESLTSLDIRHCDKDMAKHPNPYFVHESELRLITDKVDGNISWWLPPSVIPSKEKVFTAIEQVELLCSWLESEYWSAIKK